eukprot:291388-Prorocentrum_minimum.AAC.2
MADQADGDEMASVKNYFETVGAERWKKIYGETDVCTLFVVLSVLDNWETFKLGRGCHARCVNGMLLSQSLFVGDSEIHARTCFANLASYWLESNS